MCLPVLFFMSVRSLFSCLSDFDLCSHEFCKLAHDRGITGPCRCRDKIAVDNRLIDRNFYIGAAGQRYIRSDCGISGCLIAFEDTGCSQYLRPVADCSDRFAGSKEFTDDFQDTCIQTDVFRSAAAGNEQAFVLLCFYSVKVSCESKIVAPRLGIGLLPEEIMDGSSDSLSGLFVGADRIHLIAQDAERLEGNHGLIILREITA